MARKRDEGKILDVNAAMQGSLVFSDPVNLRINGTFEGNLTVKGSLTIGKNAKVKADIIGETIIINGTVKGTIKATQILKLESTAHVVGDIEVSRLSIEDGAIFDGKCKMFDSKISLKELSEYLSVEEKKIKEWVESGQIPVEQEGGKLMFDRKEVETWVVHKH